VLLWGFEPQSRA